MNTDANAQRDVVATEKVAWEKPALTLLDARMTDITTNQGGGQDSTVSTITVS